jgi:ABC-type sugar transport system permease subunit
MVTILTVPILVAEGIFRLKSKRAGYWYRILMILPAVIPGIVIILIWQFIYEPRVGLANALLTAIGLESLTRAWLGDPSVVIGAIMFAGFPFVGGVTVLIYLAGLQSIPQEVHDASLVDGATGLRQIWAIDVPYIMGQIKLNVVLGIIGSLQGFAGIWVFTQGGPAYSSMVPGLWLYVNAFQFAKVGYASAIGVFLFAIIMVLTFINMKFIRTATY